MHKGKYSLSWHTYSDHLKSMMKEFMMNEDFSDITLVTDDKRHIKANINILSMFSPVFKDILKKDKSSNQIMYLRGVQFSEMESILQFIYLGEASFYEERMDEFLAVAKSLEIKEICNAKTESYDKSNDETLTNDQDTPTEVKEEQIVIPDKIKIQAPKERQRKDSVNGTSKYACDQCERQFSTQSNLIRHIQSLHEGTNYACDQCDFKANCQRQLTSHIQSKHESIKYACDQCDYQATQQGHLKIHIQ